jgi:hypothetical protein
MNAVLAASDRGISGTLWFLPRLNTTLSFSLPLTQFNSICETGYLEGMHSRSISICYGNMIYTQGRGVGLVNCRFFFSLFFFPLALHV